MSACPSLAKILGEPAPLVAVHQTDDHGCSAGALATLLGVTYETAKQIIPAHKCAYSGCVKCRPGSGRRGAYDYMACAGHMASILRFHGFRLQKTENLYSQDVYPVLAKISWSQWQDSNHFVIWDPRQKHFVCSSAGVRPSYEKDYITTCFGWADEPAYIVKHPKFLPQRLRAA